ncbi:docking domain of Afi1 for Arf3 in vesicle trafficking-domain-containing protein [Gamsiella multidivaricata]|uniref:docking domain of Afi1 for Arf3 in vesicle trafficking-domain-containing protein n=1 Tax=Gamsiella multidivaricata TaxID=101098 RepID=UPI00221EA5E8|nr:docking domain of Afi1 for Arf3 in vesicle trafficking-domain-containing protein [Gamsiella multidivaricata]KAI7827443.1 docking domain of Afi1 for Arf3 in vesicle trafficking-domain-containing protein [Gamsiella multidivaricata]
MAPQHVTTILLAEFDIDQGSTLTHQYPTNITSDNHVLAELMLPDGAHLRPADWTIFFLNQAKPAPWNGNNALTDEVENPLLYVLNLVRTNHDASIRRGAAVKAMAICTTHQYLHPVLLLALENYFKDPSVEVLKTLYESVNSMELSPPDLSPYERMILRSSDNKELFIEKFEAATGASEDAPGKVDMTYGLGIVVGQAPLKGKEGGAATALAAATAAMAKNRDCQFYETKVVYDGIKIPIRVPLSINPEEVGEFSLIKLITTFSPASPSPNSHPFHAHLDSNGPNTHPIMLLMNALLTGKRIIFLGNGHPAGDVANFVLAACALGSGSGGVLRGFPERAYPYTNLAGIDHLLTCKGFIAGVTNQLFEDRTAWWDVLCNIDTGKITVSKDITPMPAMVSQGSGSYDDTRPIAIFSGAPTSQPSGKYDNGDNEFMTDILNAIQAHYGETVIRAKFQDYVTRFVQLASQYEEQTYGQTTIGLNRVNTPESTKYLGTGLVFADETSRAREIAANASRIEGWRATTSYTYLQEDHKAWLSSRSIKCMDVKRVISLLKLARTLSPQDVSTLFKGFLQNISTDEQIIEFLSSLPLSQGGLFCIAYGLFHPMVSVRNDTIAFFNRLNQHPTGRVYIKSLNQFERNTYERLAREYAVQEENSIKQHHYARLSASAGSISSASA